MSELTNEQEAEKLAKKIKRCLDSIPDKFTVVITNSTIQVCCKDEFDEYFQKEGDIDNPPSIAYEIFNVMFADAILNSKISVKQE